MTRFTSKVGAWDSIRRGFGGYTIAHRILFASQAATRPYAETPVHGEVEPLDLMSFDVRATPGATASGARMRPIAGPGISRAISASTCRE